MTDVVVQGPANANTSGRRPARRGARRGRLARRHQAQRRRRPRSPRQRHLPLRQRRPGHVQNLDFAGNSTPIPPDALTQARIGRIALGIADGADQDHRVVYALVQDAVKFNGGVAGLDANENGTTSPRAERLPQRRSGSSTDFGKTWQDARGLERRSTTTRTSNSALAPPTCKTPGADLLLPGNPGLVQPLGPARPDAVDRVAASRRGSRSASRRSGRTAAPRPASTARRRSSSVVGRYFARRRVHAAQRDQRAAGLPGRRRRHRAQDHDAPRPARLPVGARRSGGGVTLFAGNDGGVYRQHLDRAASRSSNDNWGRGANTGMQHAAALRRRDGQGRHASTWACRTTARARSTPTARRTRSTAATASSPRSIPTTPTTPTRSTRRGDISATKDGGKTWTDIAAGEPRRRARSPRRSRWTPTTRTT